MGKERTQTNLLTSYKKKIYALNVIRETLLNKDTTEIQEGNGASLFKSLFQDKRQGPSKSILFGIFKGHLTA